MSFFVRRSGVNLQLHHSLSKMYWQHEVFAGFLYYKSIPFYPSHTVLFRRKSLYSADMCMKNYTSPPWRWSTYINYLELFCMGVLSFLHTYCFHQYGVMDICFILWAIIKYNFISLFFQLVLVLFWHNLHHCGNFVYFFCFLFP